MIALHIVAIGAHNDDLIIGAGGYLIKQKASSKITLVVMVNHYVAGESSQRNRAIHDICRSYGWNLQIFDYHDTAIPTNLAVVTRVARLLQQAGCSRLIVPAAGRHIDHGVVSLVVRQALRLARINTAVSVCDAYKGCLASFEVLDYTDVSDVFKV